MGTRSVGILVTWLFVLDCFAYKPVRYSDLVRHFSLTIPENWKVVHAEELPPEKIELLENRYGNSEPVAVCHEIDGNCYEPPYILIHFVHHENLAETYIEEIFQSHMDSGRFLARHNMTISYLQEARGYRPKSWKHAKLVQSEIDYDVEKHVGFQTIELYHEDVGKIIAVIVRVLGRRRTTVLEFYLDGDDVERSSSLIGRVVDSFAYDNGYGFGQTGKVAGAWRPAKIFLLACLLVLALNGIGIFAFSKLFRKKSHEGK